MTLGYHKDGFVDVWCGSNQRTDTHCREERLNSRRWAKMASSSRGWRGWWNVKDSCLDNIQCPEGLSSEDCQPQAGCH